MNKSVLSFQNVSFTYKNGDEPILKSLNLDVKEGEFVSIVGASGSGKSTLFRLITGLEQQSEGDIVINGHSYEKRLGKVGYMPQQDLLLPWRTILDNAALPLELHNVSKASAHRQVSQLLEEFGLKGYENRFPSDLSGGMKQRVSFLRTVLSGSNVLLLDEPFSALDAITRLSMQEWLLEQWQKRKHTILFITHDVNEALFLSDRIFIFSEKPVSHLEEIQVPLSRPRMQKDLNQQRVLDVKDYLIEQLRSKVNT
ncbi:ABC transporter ATP-binding protein [Priestia aryabhattai]|uniref:ABC transporter ATP-binding protein n=1 Tax=Priestia megaterium TaxID=1404 RepID=UPI0039B8C77B